MSSFLSFLSLAILFSACSCKKYVRDNKSSNCVFNFRSIAYDLKEVPEQTLGIKYTYTAKETRREFKICCPFDQPSVYFSRRRRNGTCCMLVYSKEWPLSNARICPSIAHVVRFSETGANYEEVNNPVAPYNKFKCPRLQALQKYSVLRKIL